MTRNVLIAAAGFVLALPVAARAQSTPDYTADLNALPPAAPRASSPSATETPPAPGRVETAQPQPASPQPTTAPRPASTNAPVASPSTAASTPPPAPAPVAQPTQPASPSAAAAPAGPRALTRAELDALPFAVALPPGYVLTAGRPGPDFQVWTVRKAGVAQLMIYAGPSSQFPIHDGQIVEAGGRSTVVVMEDGRRRALEHLFRQSTAPNHIHVWVASVDGPDRDQAEAIGHGVSPR